MAEPGGSIRNGMRRSVVPAVVTGLILLSLVLVAQPSSAVLATVAGPDELGRTDTGSFDSTVEIRPRERVPIENFLLFLTTEDGQTVTVTFSPDGTVRDVDPPRGTVGRGAIRIGLLRRTLEIAPGVRNADFGFGERSGIDERDGRRFDFGYGYGYGGSDLVSFAFRVEVDSRAFKRGEYGLQIGVETEHGTVFRSNVETFEVVNPGTTAGPSTVVIDGPGR